MIREKIRAELPTLLKLYRADKFLVNRIVASATTFFEEVRNDPKHPFRDEFNRMLLSFVDRLGTDQAFADRIDGLKRDLLARPELGDARAQHLVERAHPSSSAAPPARPRCCNSIWRRCSSRPARRWPAMPSCAARSTRASSPCSRSFIADQKSGVSTFISDQVKSWDMGQLISLIEINIGKDLQYIRFNGSLIGGLAGLALYTLEYLLRLL